MRIRLTESQYKSLISEKKLRTYAFDWDDNILRMPTKIYLEKDGKEVAVSTEKYAEIRNNPEYKRKSDSYKDFTDSPEGNAAFIRDVKTAIDNKAFAPSKDKFEESLVYANNFAINTARGHSMDTLRDGVRLYIDMVLSDDQRDMMVSNIRKELPMANGLSDDQAIDLYLDERGSYYPVTSGDFASKFGVEGGSAANPEEYKKIALEDFVKSVLKNVEKLIDKGYTGFSMGFSDDDLGNVRASEEFIENQLSHLYPEVHFVVYDTSEGGKNKLIVKRED